MNLTVWEWNHEPSWPDLFANPSYVEASDWYGAPSKRGPLRWYVAVSPARVWWAFSCSGTLSTIETASSGERVEGLWELDVAELFVADSESDRYLEWNLGPQGAWWGCTFDAYRVRAAVVDGSEHDVQSFSERSSDGWRGGISYRRAASRSLFGPPQQVQCCAIMDSPHQRFFSSRPVRQGGEPDFHLRSSFQASLFRAVAASRV